MLRAWSVTAELSSEGTAAVAIRRALALSPRPESDLCGLCDRVSRTNMQPGAWSKEGLGKLRRRARHPPDASPRRAPRRFLSASPQLIRVFAAHAAARPQARNRAASGLAQPRTSLPSSAPRVRRLPVPLPRSSDPTSVSAGRLLLPQRHESIASPPPRRRRDPKQQGQGKVQTGEKIRAPLAQRARSQQLP